ncbi:MAG: hypothetical protein IKG27_06885 [Bacilli bacterium]|nr:hypothetical protein [Bacilli bacterium]
MEKDKKGINLEGIFYDEKGNFTPLTDNKGITSGQLAHLRNTYMEAEKEYFEVILSDDALRNGFLDLLKEDSEELLKKALEIQYKLETGQLESEEDLEKMKEMNPEERDELHMMRLEQAEGLMCLYYAAVRDKVKVLDLVYRYEAKEKTR